MSSKTFDKFLDQQIKILKSRERERFHEFLITNEEQAYCCLLYTSDAADE